MLRFAANLSLLFTDVPFLDRIDRAARAGFGRVEFQFPYDLPARDIRERLDAAGVQAVLHNLPAGDWAAGERGIAGHPDRVDEFRAGVARGLAYARALDVFKLNALAGLAPPGVSAAVVRRTLVDNLRHAARELARDGRQLMVEALNTRDVPGFLLHGTEQTVELLDEVGEPNAFVQYDAYHMQRMEGELAATLQRFLPRIGHVQIADNPGRHEPGTGEIRYEFLLRHLESLGWTGDVGVEYRPQDEGPQGTERGLHWMRPYRA